MQAFEDLLLDAVNEGLSSLGESGKQAIYAFLTKTYKLDEQDIPHRIEEFKDAIEKIFGLGAKFLEILIMKRVYEKFGQDFIFNQEPEDLIFVEYIEAARKTYLKKMKNELVNYV
jgi:hypothetical protein